MLEGEKFESVPPWYMCSSAHQEITIDFVLKF
jgi:hypothetical protein